MPEQVLLGFDFGQKKIGVAVGNTLTRQARPLTILLPKTREERFKQIAALLEEWQPERLIVGLPLTIEGLEQDASRASRRFANQLNGRFGKDVQLVDEKGSSLEAQALLDSHAPDDAMAAAVILQRYLDALDSLK